MNPLKSMELLLIHTCITESRIWPHNHNLALQNYLLPQHKVVSLDWGVKPTS